MLGVLAVCAHAGANINTICASTSIRPTATKDVLGCVGPKTQGTCIFTSNMSARNEAVRFQPGLGFAVRNPTFTHSENENTI
jgi:hypothetical protein